MELDIKLDIKLDVDFDIMEFSAKKTGP